jgi:hypothetical protein
LIHLTNAVLVYFFVKLTFKTPYFNGKRLKVKSERPEEGRQETKDES